MPVLGVGEHFAPSRKSNKSRKLHRPDRCRRLERLPENRIAAPHDPARASVEGNRTGRQPALLSALKNA